MYKRLTVTAILALRVGLVPVLFLGAEPASGQASSQTQFTQPGFTDTLVTNVDAPTALAFTPDGRMLITNQQGQLRVYENNLASTALSTLHSHQRPHIHGGRRLSVPPSLSSGE